MSRLDQRGNDRGSQTSRLGMIFSVLDNPGIGRLDRLTQTALPSGGLDFLFCLSISPGGFDVARYGLDGNLTRDLPGFGATHPVRHNIQPPEIITGYTVLPDLFDQHGIFVMVAHLSDIGPPGRTDVPGLTQREQIVFQRVHIRIALRRLKGESSA